tara:strand:+ start:197 stop:475 length:279 start_codon:yes stop_codon:yes gene_type:complete
MPEFKKNPSPFMLKSGNSPLYKDLGIKSKIKAAWTAVKTGFTNPHVDTIGRVYDVYKYEKSKMRQALKNTAGNKPKGGPTRPGGKAVDSEKS